MDNENTCAIIRIDHCVNYDLDNKDNKGTDNKGTDNKGTGYIIMKYR